MFTGIIEEVGRVAGVRELGGGRRLTLEARLAPELRPDQSIAVNGACQTVVQVKDHTFDVVAVEETLRKTTLGDLAVGDPVNLERALRPDGRLDGHLVLGHVDATGVVSGVEARASSWLFRIRFEASFAPYLIPVGSVTVDGISLTVARLHETEFTVSIIPHTYEHTNVSTWRVGKKVNLEFDMIGKYVLRALATRGLDAPAASAGLTEDWLKAQGFGS
ncbi:MAG: riboflavin synthase [Bacteroidetes bacterium]|nr:MAG: riboflavin synthase [Bacteroidota bacterium]